MTRLDKKTKRLLQFLDQQGLNWLTDELKILRNNNVFRNDSIDTLGVIQDRSIQTYDDHISYLLFRIKIITQMIDATNMIASDLNIESIKLSRINASMEESSVSSVSNIEYNEISIKFHRLIKEVERLSNNERR